MMITNTDGENTGAPPLPQCFSWWAFCKGIAPDVLCREAARIGYQGAEFVPLQHFALAREQGLRIVSIGGHQSLGDGLNRLTNHDRVEAEIAANLEKAREWDIPYLIVFSGNRNGLSDEEGRDATVKGLRRVAPLAEAAGVTLILELLNSRRDHADYQADSTVWGASVCELVGSPRVKLLYDIYHMQIMEGNLCDTITKNAAQIAHYHTAGVPGRHDLDDTQEINYPAVVRAIKATGYNGYLGHEFTPKGDTVAALEAAFHVCQL